MIQAVYNFFSSLPAGVVGFDVLAVLGVALLVFTLAGLFRSLGGVK